MLQPIEKCSKAFTLIEMIVVLTIMACAAGLIVPRIGSSLSRQELWESGQRLALMARSTREVAIARQQLMVIQIDIDRGGFMVCRRDKGGQLEPVRTSWLRPQQLPEAVKIAEIRLPDGTTAMGGTHQVSFDPDGTSSGAFLRLVSGDRERLVMIRPGSGQANVGDASAMAAVQDQYDLGD